MTQLQIPYRSQWAPDADAYETDCGPTCLAMILNYYNKPMTPDEMYDFLPKKGKSDFVNFMELNNAAKQNQITMKWKQYNGRHQALLNLRTNMEANKPMIALVKYKPWRSVTLNPFDWGHFVVVTGYTSTHVTIHDPLFGLWVTPASKGAHFTMTHDDFCAGWGGFPVTENPNFACSVVENAGTSTPQPPRIVQPPRVVQPPTTTTSPPAQTGDLQELTPETRKRIYALAGYRWATKPNLDNDQEAQLWLTHLGDFGAETKTHVVQSGDTFSGLAARYYGGQNRWRAIQAYNNMTRDALWLGERLTIPMVGSSNAHTNPALPHDTIDPNAKSLEDLASLIDPEAPMKDYNSLGANSVGMGFVE